MKNILLSLLLFTGSMVSAEKLDLIFRYYGKDGRLVTTPINLYLDFGESELISSADAGGWQHWQVEYNGLDLHFQVVNRSPDQRLTIQIHPDWQKTLKTLVINRVQESDVPWVVKVNHLTCRWTAGIAYPIEYRFNNPLDGQELKLQSWSCAKDQDSLRVSIHILSDSVMLYRCGKSEAILAKYYLGSDGQLFRSFAPSECHEFSTNAERELYLLLKDSSTEIHYSWEGSRFVLIDAKGCRWEFSF